jgi:DNA-binding transcriptional ArsR family regulator
VVPNRKPAASGGKSKRNAATSGSKPKRTEEKIQRPETDAVLAATKDTKPVDLIDRRLTKALSHPMRVQILALVNQRVLSPKEFSREYNEPLSNVAYHFRELEKLDCIELIEERPGRGSHQHFYKGARRGIVSDADWKQLGKAVQAGVSTAALQDFIGRSVQAIMAGTFDARDDSHFSWTALSLDQQGWDDLVESMTRMLDDTLNIEAEAAERLAGSKEKPIPATFALAGFESPTEEEAKQGKRERTD